MAEARSGAPLAQPVAAHGFALALRRGDGRALSCRRGFALDGAQPALRAALVVPAGGNGKFLCHGPPGARLAPGAAGTRLAPGHRTPLGRSLAMATDAMHHHHRSASSNLPRWMVVGFIAGALSVLIFHQGAWALLHAMNFTPRAPFPMQPTQPLGVPQLWSLAFFGGIWGLLLAASFGRLDGARLVVASVIFGAILPTL